MKETWIAKAGRGVTRVLTEDETPVADVYHPFTDDDWRVSVVAAAPSLLDAARAALAALDEIRGPLPESARAHIDAAAILLAVAIEKAVQR